MTADPSIAAAIASSLQANGHVLESPVRDVRELMTQLSRAATPIVLVDLDPHPQDMLRQVERIVARFPSSRFVALSTSLQNELLLDAMQTGIRRVVVKQTMGTELAGVLDRLTASESAPEASRGELITIFSASGGCGATTVAVNLAEELALEQKQPTLVWDLDCSYGAVSSYLGLHPHYAIDQILNSSGTIDAQLIQSTATVTNERIHVLASPATVAFAGPEMLQYDRLEQALDSSRQAYQSTIVDAPRISMRAAATLAATSSFSLLVFQLTVKDLRIARTMLDALRQNGVDTSSIIPIANRYAKRQMIGLEDASKALDGAQIVPIRNDYTPAITGLNYGQLLSEAGPRSSFRKDLQELLARQRQT
jgi:pilus assembly protein CpaE